MYRASEQVVVEFTLGEYLDAMEKNGYPQGFHHGMQTDDADVTIIDACALGQANLNMGIAHDFHTTVADLLDFVTPLNDKKRVPVPLIAKRARRYFKDELDRKLHSVIADYGRLENYKGGKFTPKS